MKKAILTLGAILFTVLSYAQDNWRIYRAGNYINAVNETTGKLHPAPLKEVTVEQTRLTDTDYQIKGLGNIPKLELSQILKEDGSPYTKEEWEDFYENNTANFSSASGGSGAVSSVNGQTGDVVIPQTFGDFLGIVTDFASLTTLTPLGALDFARVENESIGNFGIIAPAGLWYWNGSAWVILDQDAVTDITSTNSTILIDNGTSSTNIEADVCGINNYIHNLFECYLVLAHEGAGGKTLTVEHNGTPATFTNLLNATDNGGGSITFLGGANQNFNRRATTEQTIFDVGDFFDIINPATGQFDTQIFAKSNDPSQTANTISTFRLVSIGSGFQLRDDSNTIVASGTQEIGTYRITRTLSGFSLHKDGVFLYETPTECIDYTEVTNTTFAFEGIEIEAFPDWTAGLTVPITATPTTPINTGVDFNEVDRMVFHFNNNGATWSVSSSHLVSEVIKDANNGALLHWFNDDYIGIRMNTADMASGVILARSVGATFRLTRIEFRKFATGTSNRVGELAQKLSTFFVDDADAISKGYLPIKSGTVPNGAVDYPVFAAGAPQFVVGNDIVFPAWVDGITTRNLGGLSGLEGVLQEDKTAVNGLAGTSIDVSRAQTSSAATGGAQRNFGQTTNTRVITLTGDDETIAANFAIQYYFIIDTYLESN